MSGISICMVNYDQNCNFEKCSSIWNHYQKSFNNFDFSLPTLSMIQIYFISWSFTLILYFSVVLNFICFTFGWRWTRMCPKYAPDWLWTNIWRVTSIVLIHLVKSSCFIIRKVLLPMYIQYFSYKSEEKPIFVNFVSRRDELWTLHYNRLHKMSGMTFLQVREEYNILFLCDITYYYCSFFSNHPSHPAFWIYYYLDIV